MSLTATPCGCSSNISASIRSTFLSDQLSLTELNSSCLKHAYPNPMVYGRAHFQTLIFTELLKIVRQLRASLDFRVLPKSKSEHMGVKILGRDYLDLDDHCTELGTKEAISVVT